MTELAVIACLAFDLRADLDELARFKQQLSRCPCVDSIMDVSGTYDLIVQCHFSSLAHYTEQIDLIRPQIARVATRMDCNFICSRIECGEDNGAGALWVPCDGGKKRVEARFIDKVLAEGDYMRVHIGSWNCLIHYTMGRLCELLASPDFIRLHRSCLVRVGFIDRLTHEGRRWKARLKDGTHVSIAQSNVSTLLRLTGPESSMTRHASSKRETPSQAGERMNERRLKVPG